MEVSLKRATEMIMEREEMDRHGAPPRLQIMEYGYRLYWSRGLLFLVYVLSIILLCGCSTSLQSPSPAQDIGNQDMSTSQGPLRLIVKFKSPTADPTSTDLMNRISEVAGVRLIHIRPMFGGAHVISTESAMESSARVKLINKLSGMDEIEYAEEDAVMKPMQGR